MYFCDGMINDFPVLLLCIMRWLFFFVTGGRGMVIFMLISIPHSDVVQYSGVSKPLFSGLPQAVHRVIRPTADAEFVVLRVCVFHALKAVFALFEVRSKSAENTPRSLAASAVQRLFDERRRIIILAVARHDVAVYAAIRDVFRLSGTQARPDLSRSS